MKKKFILLGALLTCFLVTACSISKTKSPKVQPVESITVFDADGNKLFKRTEKEILDRFSDYASDTEVDGSDLLEKMPADAVVAYRYVYKTDPGRELVMRSYVNKDILFVEGLPIVGDVRIKLEKESADWFRNSQNW